MSRNILFFFVKLRSTLLKFSTSSKFSPTKTKIILRGKNHKILLSANIQPNLHWLYSIHIVLVENGFAYRRQVNILGKHYLGQPVPTRDLLCLLYLLLIGGTVNNKYRTNEPPMLIENYLFFSNIKHSCDLGRTEKSKVKKGQRLNSRIMMHNSLIKDQDIASCQLCRLCRAFSHFFASI